MVEKENEPANGERRRSRKEILRQRKYERQTRQVRLFVAGIVGLVLLIVLVAVVNEFILRPAQPVAEVNDEEISLSSWQDRVRYRRAQTIIQLEEQLEAFQGDVGLVQQISGQQIVQLAQQPEQLAELVLEQMIAEVLLQQAAEERGLEVTDEEVEARIAEQYNFFGGESPTPVPSPTQLLNPTPSLTPIPTEAITEVLPTNTPAPTLPPAPTGTPLPTATPVTEEVFLEEYGDFLERLEGLGVEEEGFLEAVRAQLVIEELGDYLAEETDLSREAEHASVFVLSFGTAEGAGAALEAVEDEGFLEVWNTIRSSAAAEPALAADASATEILFRTEEQIAAQLSPAVAEAAFELPLGEPSDVIAPDPTAGEEAPAPSQRYYLVQVSGREMRELPPNVYESQQQELVVELLEELEAEADIERFAIWQARVPTQPALDPAFLVPPTPAPEQPPVELEPEP
ncbi:MAG: SurA N-terminal domain-containing protein [Candidatus Promineifilaceae bacterium]|nr:SurA N-terminal domain-containing protein [Candidatus Promineifilaceae bacterium]